LKIIVRRNAHVAKNYIKNWGVMWFWCYRYRQWLEYRGTRLWQRYWQRQ